MLKRLFTSFSFLGLISISSVVLGDAACAHRGSLDQKFCDEDFDLIADPPKKVSQYKDPDTLYFSYSAKKNPEKYVKLYQGFLEHLSQCTGKPAKYYKVISKAAEAEAMINGDLHIAGFSTGAVPQAVNAFGVRPFATQGDENEAHGYKILVIVKKNSPYQTFQELKGKRFAHANPSSNSGHIAPMALFPQEGMMPGKDYEILFSGSHVNSVLGVASGKYDAATTNTHAFRKPKVAEKVSFSDFRVLYTSPKFPGTAITMAHDLKPELAEKISQCTYEYRFGKEFQKRYSGADRFVPVNYQKDWKVVREVAQD